MLHPTKSEGDGRDAAILDQAGLLRPGKCVLAHGVHISPDERALLQTSKAAIAHCPLSNVFFAQGVLPVKSMMADGYLNRSSNPVPSPNPYHEPNPYPNPNAGPNLRCHDWTRD